MGQAHRPPDVIMGHGLTAQWAELTYDF
ncbi:uncharacterized, partial [Tachysurus ichikawai]